MNQQQIFGPSVKESLDCSNIKLDYKELQSSLCEATIGGWTENLVMISLQIPVMLAMTVLGSMIQYRNGVDIPKITIPKPPKPPKGKDANKGQGFKDSDTEGEVKQAEEQESLLYK